MRSIPSQIRLPIYCLLLLLFTTAASHAQRVQKLDVIQLQNGKIYQGHIMPQNDATRIKLQTKDLSILWFNAADITSKTATTAPRPLHDVRDSITALFWPNRLTAIFEAGFAIPILGEQMFNQSYTARIGGFRASLGWNMTTHLFLGAGMGIDKAGPTLFYPFYLDLRARLTCHRWSPMITMTFGYALVNSFHRLLPGNYLARDFNRWGGVYANPAIGVSRCLSPKIALHFLVGLRIQHVHFGKGFLNDIHQVGTTETDFLNVKVGISF